MEEEAITDGMGAAAMSGDFSVKLNFSGPLTLEVIQDALLGTQLLMGHTEGVLKQVLGTKVKLGTVQVRKIEQGSFIGDLKALVDSCGTILEKSEDMPMGKLITVCVTGLLISGMVCYTVQHMPADAPAAPAAPVNRTVHVQGDNNGIAGDVAAGATVNINIAQDTAALAAMLKEQYPDADELCDKVAEAVIRKLGKPAAAEAIKKAAVHLCHPGKNKVDSIELSTCGSTGETARAVIGRELTAAVPPEYKKEEPEEQKRLLSGIYIQIRRMNVDSCPEGTWGAAVDDIETGLPDRTLPLIVDSQQKAWQVHQHVSKPFKVDMWAVFRRDSKGNPVYLRYILKEIKED